MSSVLRTLSKHTRTLSGAARTPVAGPSRAFHSPFAVLSSANSPLTASPTPSATAGIYEKNIEYPAEPFTSGFGTRTYVVSTPDPANAPYEVPIGAYPVSSPFQTQPRAEPPTSPRFTPSGSGFAHPLASLPRNDSGASSA